MRMSRAQLDDIVDHAQADAPNECCGIVSSIDDEAVTVYRATNVHASPLRFEIDGRELLKIDDDIRAAGADIGVIYHSHTRSEPYPSQTDTNFAREWPGIIWIIVGLAQNEPVVRSYEIRDGEIIEVELDVTE